MFKSRKKTLNISDRDPTYKVRYVGNVLTAFMRGEGCVDKPVSILWNNYDSRPDAAFDMQLTVCASGLKARTKDSGLTEYRSHRISYCVCHPLYPRLFAWVYRHEGKKMKVELRCHAVLCKSDAVAKAIAVQLHDKLSFALSEFTRERTRRQRARLAIQRANSAPNGGSAEPFHPSNTTAAPTARTKFLTVGQHFKPPSDQSPGAPKLCSISEDMEEETTTRTVKGEVVTRKPCEANNSFHSPDEKEQTEVKMIDESQATTRQALQKIDDCDSSTIIITTTTTTSSQVTHSFDEEVTCCVGLGRLIKGELSDGVIDLEIGNDIQLFKNDAEVQEELVQSEFDNTETH